MTKLYTDPQWLSQQYASGKSWYEIARDCGVGDACIRQWARRFGIKSRMIGEAVSLKWNTDIEYRDRATIGIRDGLRRSKPVRVANSKSMWNKHRERLLKTMRSPEYRQKQRTSQRLRMRRPDQLALATETLRRCNLDPVIRQKIAAGRTRWINSNRQLLSDNSRLRWQDDTYRQKVTVAVRLATSRITWRTAQGTRSRELWERPAYRRAVTTSNRLKWEQQYYRERQAISRSAIAKTSILERITAQALTEIGHQPLSQIALGPWVFDLQVTVGDCKFLIEVQGDYWHSLPKAITRDKQKRTYFERYLAPKGYELHYLYEHQFYGVSKLHQVLRRLLRTTTPICPVNMQSLSVAPITKADANDFFWKYHYLGTSRAGLDLGARLGEQLVACCRFTGVTRKQTAERLGLRPNQTLELDRLCIHPNYQVKNLASWFLARCRRLVPPGIKCLVSFADEGAGHSGTVYRAAGWQYDGMTKPTYWYLDRDGHRYHKKTVWDQSRRLRMTEAEYAAARGLTRINGKPLRRFLLWL